MSVHPNVILMAVLVPDDLARKTHRGIVEKYADRSYFKDETDIIIHDERYHTTVMEDSYDEGYQIQANEGNIVVFNFVTYGYGETISWDGLEDMKSKLEEWAQVVATEFNCSYRIEVTANYW